MEKLGRYDIKNVLEDLNAKVGKEEICQNIVGGHSLHEVGNDNVRMTEVTETQMEMQTTSWL